MTRISLALMPRHHRYSTLLLAALIVLAISGISLSAFTSPGQSQTDQQKPISVISELVVVPVSVIDAHGNFVPGLSKETFRVYENNHPQEVSRCSNRKTRRQRSVCWWITAAVWVQNCRMWRLRSQVLHVQAILGTKCL